MKVPDIDEKSDAFRMFRCTKENHPSGKKLPNDSVNKKLHATQQPYT